MDNSKFAFPLQCTLPGENGLNEGLSMREYFAGLAMQGMAGLNGFSIDHVHRIAEISVKQADALIEALNKTK